MSQRFSQDFTQKTGNTPLNYRILVEDPATGTEYWVTNEQAQAILKGEVDDEQAARSQAITDESAARIAADLQNLSFASGVNMINKKAITLGFINASGDIEQHPDNVFYHSGFIAVIANDIIVTNEDAGSVPKIAL